MNLYQLVYSSTKTPLCNEREIEKILESCRRNNPTKEITGVLLHSSSYFIQYLEGPKEIIELYDSIKLDPRHKNIALISYSNLKERVFPSWHMGYRNVTTNEIEFLTSGSKEDQRLFNSIIKGEKQTSVSATKLLVRFFSKQ
jgi:hypothetical protein